MGKKGKYNQKNDQQDTKKKNFIITQQHLMDKTHMETTQYLPYLPINSIYPPYEYSQTQFMIVRQIVKDLNFTLYLEFKNFWATVLYNPSFKNCVHTCIRFLHRRWMNQYISLSQISQQQQQQSQDKVKYEQTYTKLKDSTYFQHIQALTKIILHIFHRIVHFQQQNLQLSNLHHIKTQIISKYILDIPRLLQIIQIYAQTNPDIVRIIVKKFLNFNQNFYTMFTSQIMQPMIAKMNKLLNVIKKTSDRQEFGIQYNYKRTKQGQLSPGEQQLKKKMTILIEVISFYETVKNIREFFPSAWSQYTLFNLQIHNINQNMFIEIEQAYKIWNNHQQGSKLYALMNRILKYIIDYFVYFLQKCQSMFITKTQKSNYKQAYMKCLDRMLENYGRRQSLGKKAATAKRYMHLYREILKIYKLDQFLGKLYIEQVQNGTYGINMDYLVDIKIAVDQQIIKISGKPKVNEQSQLQLQRQRQRARQQEVKTQADINQQKQLLQQQQQQHKNNSNSSYQATTHPPTTHQPDNLELLISKKNRQQNYYQKLYSNYRTKIVIQYDDEYDDLQDYQKRPLFQDNAKQEQDSSDGSSGDQFDPEVEQLHLVKSNSNVSRARGIGQSHQQHQKYNRKDKAKFVPVREAQAKAIINRQMNKKQYNNSNNSNNYKNSNNNYPQKQKPTYLPKQQQSQKQAGTDKNSTKTSKNEYNDQQCYQQCRQKNKQQKQIRQEQRKRQIKQDKINNNKDNNRDEDYNDQIDNSDQDGNRRGGGYRGGARGGRGGRGGSNYNNNNNKPKGTNTNKKPKYVQKT